MTPLVCGAERRKEYTGTTRGNRALASPTEKRGGAVPSSSLMLGMCHILSSLFSTTVIVVSLVGVSTILTARCDLFLCPPILLTCLFFFASYFSLFKVLYANPYYASYSSSRRLIRNKLIIYFVQNSRIIKYHP